MLLVATMLTLAAVGAGSDDLQPSALRVMLTAVVGLLSLLFWPGAAATPARTAWRVVAWSAAATLLAAVALRVTGQVLQPWPRILSSCAMLLLILLVAHALAAALEARLRAGRADAHGAREAAGRTVAMVLALLGTLPLWAGPLAELLSGRHEWAVDAAVAASPLTHLAVASGNDLLRNQWLYQHANLAGLQFSYPGLFEVAVSYAAMCLLLALGAFAFGRRRGGIAHPNPVHPLTEKSP
jgi:hypothetical protein